MILAIAAKPSITSMFWRVLKYCSPKSRLLRESTMYVSGLAMVNAVRYCGRLFRGKSAPLRKKSGKITKVVMSWKPSGLVMRLPMVRPTAVSPEHAITTINSVKAMEVKV